MKNWLIVCLCLVVSASAFAEESKGMLDWEELPPLPDELGVAGPFAGTSGDAPAGRPAGTLRAST